MPLVQRPVARPAKNVATADVKDAVVNTKKASSSASLPFLALVVLFVILFYSSSDGNSDSTSMIRVGVGNDGYLLVESNQRVGRSRRVTLMTKSECKSPTFAIWVDGVFRAGVMLKQDSMSSNRFSGVIPPMSRANYSISIDWYGCSGMGSKESYSSELLSLQSHSLRGINATNSWFPASAWFPSSDFQHDSGAKFIWHDVQSPPSNAKLIKLTSTALSPSGTEGPKGLYKFKDLSNYEIVCFVGDSRTLYDRFLEIRPKVAPGQRPFKFHHYKLTDYGHPDQSWPDSEKERFRKCKHVFVSVDEPDKGLSQTEYTDQVSRFLHHLEQAFPDQTFPIWILTVNDPLMTRSSCHTPTLPKSSDHPCNDALRNMFVREGFQSRVQLMDNSDAALPVPDVTMDDILSVIAYRIFVLIGKQVETWRQSGQKGIKEGLKRGDKLEPNQALVPYTAWTTAS